MKEVMIPLPPVDIVSTFDQEFERAFIAIERLESMTRCSEVLQAILTER